MMMSVKVILFVASTIAGTSNHMLKRTMIAASGLFKSAMAKKVLVVAVLKKIHASLEEEIATQMKNALEI